MLTKQLLYGLEGKSGGTDARGKEYVTFTGQELAPNVAASCLRAGCILSGSESIHWVSTVTSRCLQPFSLPEKA